MTVARTLVTCDAAVMRALALPLLLAACVQPATRPVAAPAPAIAAPPPVEPSNPAVGGVRMPGDRPIADAVALAPNLALLVSALAAGGMAETLRGPGPFTLFAPTDAAFGRLQPGTVEALVKPENRAALVKLLGLHVVPERLDTTELRRRIAAGGGRATLTTVAGEALTATLTGGILTLTDAGGNRGYVETADVRAANGVIHVVNGVLVPRLN